MSTQRLLAPPRIPGARRDSWGPQELQGPPRIPGALVSRYPQESHKSFVFTGVLPKKHRFAIFCNHCHNLLTGSVLDRFGSKRFIQGSQEEPGRARRSQEQRGGAREIDLSSHFEIHFWKWHPLPRAYTHTFQSADTQPLSQPANWGGHVLQVSRKSIVATFCDHCRNLLTGGGHVLQVYSRKRIALQFFATPAAIC